MHSLKYLNNPIEQDLRSFKPSLGPMLGFKRFGTEAIVIAEIELLRREQFRRCAGRTVGAYLVSLADLGEHHSMLAQTLISGAR